MKKIVLLIIFYLLLTPIFSQVTEVEYSREGYKYSKSHYDKELVYFNDSLSVSQPIEGKIVTNNKGMVLPNYVDTTGLYVYINHSKEIMYQRSSAFKANYYVIVDSVFTPLNWELIDSTEQVGNYTCQLAKTVCYGRTYYAWYTSQIPSDKGPWKLSGLPGLIIYAFDKDKRYEWKALKVTQNVEFDFSIFPSSDVQLNPKEFREKGSELLRRKEKALQAKAAQLGGTGTLSLSKGGEGMELTETRNEQQK